MLFQPFNSLFEICFVYLTRCQAETQIVARNTDWTTSKVRVEYLVTVLGIVVKQPSIQRNWLLCRMETPVFRRSLRHTLVNLCVLLEWSPCVFCHRHWESLGNCEFTPHNEASCRWHLEVVRSPYNLISWYPEQFLEVFFRRSGVPRYSVLLFPVVGGVIVPLEPTTESVVDLYLSNLPPNLPPPFSSPSFPPP